MFRYAVLEAGNDGLKELLGLAVFFLDSSLWSLGTWLRGVCALLRRVYSHIEFHFQRKGTSGCSREWIVDS